MKTKILQYLADYIILNLEQTMDHENFFYFYLEMGLWLDYYAIEVFGVYLK